MPVLVTGIQDFSLLFLNVSKVRRKKEVLDGRHKADDDDRVSVRLRQQTATEAHPPYFFDSSATCMSVAPLGE
jgi:hypothetical protein